MKVNEILQAIEPLGTPGYRKILANHGVPEPMYGVKISDMKALLKIWKIKKDYQLALDLFDCEIYDARYLAGLIADEALMTRDNLEHWVRSANCPALSQSTVAWVTAESAHGYELALDWIESGRENIASSGWAVLGNVVALRRDSELDVIQLRTLLNRVQTQIHAQPDDVRYSMNNFVICVGSYVGALTEEAIAVGNGIGQVTVDMGNTACKVPFPPDYIRKLETRGTIGRKRKTVRC